MLEICGNCRKPIKPGETTISVVRNLKKIFYHARCFGAKHLEEQNQTAPDLKNQKEELPLPKN